MYDNTVEQVERRKSTRMSLEHICELEANYEIYKSMGIFQDHVLDGNGVPQAREAVFAGVHHIEYVMEATC